MSWLALNTQVKAWLPLSHKSAESRKPCVQAAAGRRRVLLRIPALSTVDSSGYVAEFSTSYGAATSSGILPPSDVCIFNGGRAGETALELRVFAIRSVMGINEMVRHR